MAEPLTDEALEAQTDKELEETIKRVERDRKRQEKKERARKVKSELRAKMSVIASTDIYNQNDDVLFDRRTLEKLQKVDIEELEYEEDEQEEGDGAIVAGLEGPVQVAGEARADSDSEEDEEKRRFEEMAAGVDEYY